MKKEINPSRAFFIKLGKKGGWEKECLEKGIVRFGYHSSIDAMFSEDWDKVWKIQFDDRLDEGAATKDTNQIRTFYKSDEKTIWITFHGGRLWWCFARSEVKRHPDRQGCYRKTLDGWHDKDIHNKILSTDKLSGKLVKVQLFQGTICEVKEFEYLKRKLNGLMLPEVEETVLAQKHLLDRIVNLMRLLTPQDFELLVDLVFSGSGWRRIGHVGKTQKTIDIDLVLPTTSERAFVQIKSKASRADFEEYLAQYHESGLYDKMFFVWHTGQIGRSVDKSVILCGPEELAKMVFDAGLTSWLLDKVS